MDSDKMARPSSAGRGRKCIQEGIHSKKTFHSKRGRTGKRKCTAAGGSRDPKKSSGLPRKCKARLKYLFMREHRQEHTIARMAKVLGVSESGYFKWCKKKQCAPYRKRTGRHKDHRGDLCDLPFFTRLLWIQKNHCNFKQDA